MPIEFKTTQKISANEDFVIPTGSVPVELYAAWYGLGKKGVVAFGVVRPSDFAKAIFHNNDAMNELYATIAELTFQAEADAKSEDLVEQYRMDDDGGAQDGGR